MRGIRISGQRYVFFICLFILFTNSVVFGESMQEELDRLCVNTQDAESLSLETLQGLVAECDQLQKRIQESNDTIKKILLFRLDKCRNFFVFNVELKQENNRNSSQ